MHLLNYNNFIQFVESICLDHQKEWIDAWGWEVGGITIGLTVYPIQYNFKYFLFIKMLAF